MEADLLAYTGFPKVNRPGSDGDSGYWFPTPVGAVCWAA